MAETQAQKIVHQVELDGPKPNLMVTEGSFKGRPVIHILYLDGAGRPMTMGAGKVKMILHALPELLAFYNKNAKGLAVANAVANEI